MCCLAHIIAHSGRRVSNDIYNDIVLEEDDWIGTNVTILPGVTIHEDVIIAAGAVLAKDVQTNELWR